MIGRRFSFVWIATVILIMTADWLFYGQPDGWTFSLFLTLTTVLVALKGGAYALTKCAMAAAFLLAGLLMALVIQPGPLVLWMALVALAILATTIRQGMPADPLQLVSRLFQFAWRIPFRPLKDARVLLFVSRLRSTDRIGKFVLSSFRKWFLPIAGTLIFSGLFAIANPVISKQIEACADLLNRVVINFRLDPPRIIFWAFAGVGAWGVLRVRSRSNPKGNVPPPLPMSQPRTALLGRCLILFNLVFAVQSIMDASYLFAGIHLPDGMSYAEYAHRGSYPLIVTALLAAAFVLIAYRPGPATRETANVRRLVLLWLFQNVFLTTTAAWRLYIYTGIYGLTRLRIAAAIWMFLVATGLAWIGLRIIGGKTNRWLVNQTLATTFIVLYMCCFVNFDRTIAWQNVRHCREVGGTGFYMDYDYMLQIGPEAIPALEWLRARGIVENKRDSLGILRGRLNRLMENWRSWTYRSWVLWNGAMD